MTYSMIIEKKLRDPEYINDIETWDEVRSRLCDGLSQGTIGVHVYKFSSNSKTIGHCHVTMCNMAKVINASSDKEALR
jgi:hypothetical protein